MSDSLPLHRPLFPVAFESKRKASCGNGSSPITWSAGDFLALASPKE